MYLLRSSRQMLPALTFTLALAAMLSLVLAFATPAHAATNLIPNGDLEAGSPTPTGWNVGGFGTNTASSSAVSGHTGRGVGISITAYTDGDRKWIFDPVTVEPGALYSFSDWYKSNVTTSIVAALSGGIDASHPDIFVPVATLPSSANAWVQTTQAFTPRLGYTKVTFYHILSSVGTLSTDDYSLTQTASSSANIFSKGIVSLTFDDGWTTQYTKGYPILGNLKATFYIIGKALKGAQIIDLFTDSNSFPPESAAATVATSTAVVWGTIYPDPTLHTYEFSDTYSASSTNSVMVTYTTGNHTATTSLEFPFAAGTNQVAKFTLNIPTQPDAGIIVRHTSGGKLVVSAKSLLADTTGYMTPAMMQALQSAGNEIGGHTESHCNLLFLATGVNGSGQATNSSDPNTCAFPAANLHYQDEVTNGFNSVIANGATNVTDFAYPNGANNQAIRDYIKNSTSFKSARTVDEGYNTKINDAMGLKVEVVDTTSTPNDNIDKVKGWIDTAAANKLWLILVFHQIDDPAALASNGENGGTTPAALTAIVNYLNTSHSSDIDVKTVRDAFALTTNITPADTTAPVIAAHADVSATATSSSSVGANVTYTTPAATDNVDASVTVTCAPVSGSLFALGTSTVTCSAHDTANNAASSTFKVIVSAAAPVVVPGTPAVAITPAAGALTAGTVGSAYSQAFVASTSATGTFTWSVLSGSLPSGLSLSTTTGLNATISGTPTATSSSSFTLRVTNGTSSTTAAYTLAVGAAAPVDPTCSATQHLDNHVCVDNPVTQPTGGSSGSSGSGGGGGGIVSGPFSIGYVNTNPTALSLPGAVLGASTNCYVFGKTLQVGSTGADVSALQSRLTIEGFFTANATGYFGSITKAAVMTFQAKNGIESVGIVGPKTRAVLNGTCPTGAPGAANQPAPQAPSAATFTQTLSMGSIGAEVTLLQKVLIDLAFLHVTAPTGYFGALTKTAVMGYQTSRGIPSTGLVGPLTRAALNSNAGATH